MYDYPFLDESSGLTLDPQSVVPLYRYMVNVNQPTMFLMGLVIRACLAVVLDAQVHHRHLALVLRFLTVFVFNEIFFLRTAAVLNCILYFLRFLSESLRQ